MKQGKRYVPFFGYQYEIFCNSGSGPTQVAPDPATPEGTRRDSPSLVRVKAASGAKTQAGEAIDIS